MKVRSRFARTYLFSEMKMDLFFYNLCNKCECIIPVYPAGGCCYWNSNKTCKSACHRKMVGGELLSNTSITSLQVWNTLGKLRLMPDRERKTAKSLSPKLRRLKMGRRPIR